MKSVDLSIGPNSDHSVKLRPAIFAAADSDVDVLADDLPAALSGDLAQVVELEVGALISIGRHACVERNASRPAGGCRGTHRCPRLAGTASRSAAATRPGSDSASSHPRASSATRATYASPSATAATTASLSAATKRALVHVDRAELDVGRTGPGPPATEGPAHGAARSGRALLAGGLTAALASPARHRGRRSVSRPALALR